MQSGRTPRGPGLILGSVTATVSAVVILGLAVAPTVGGDHPWGRFFHKHFHHGGGDTPGDRPRGVCHRGLKSWMHPRKSLVMGNRPTVHKYSPASRKLGR
jgi:hypothetical protein